MYKIKNVTLHKNLSSHYLSKTIKLQSSDLTVDKLHICLFFIYTGNFNHSYLGNYAPVSQRLVQQVLVFPLKMNKMYSTVLLIPN